MCELDQIIGTAIRTGTQLHLYRFIGPFLKTVSDQTTLKPGMSSKPQALLSFSMMGKVYHRSVLGVN